MYMPEAVNSVMLFSAAKGKLISSDYCGNLLNDRMKLKGRMQVSQELLEIFMIEKGTKIQQN